MKKIDNEADYSNVMKKIDKLMAKGSDKVSENELLEIRQLALDAQAYEQLKHVIEPPSTLFGMIEMKMLELRLKQKDLAQKLNISDTKLSMIMNGKQKPDISFLKSVYKELNINAEFILDHV